jgi:hypothetical protein
LIFAGCVPEIEGAAVPNPGPTEGALGFADSELVPEIMVGSVDSGLELGVKFS